jgi:hypothetical protein
LSKYQRVSPPKIGILGNFGEFSHFDAVFGYDVPYPLCIFIAESNEVLCAQSSMEITGKIPD